MGIIQNSKAYVQYSLQQLHLLLAFKYYVKVFPKMTYNILFYVQIQNQQHTAHVTLVLSMLP